MAITYLDVEERMQITFPTETATIFPLQSGVTAWIANTIPRTIAKYATTSSDELILDLAVDLVKEFRWEKTTGGANSIQTPAGTKNYTKKPSYPSFETIAKYGLKLIEDVEPQQWYYSNGDA